jgi:hypothetical protein
VKSHQNSQRPKLQNLLPKGAFGREFCHLQARLSSTEEKLYQICDLIPERDSDRICERGCGSHRTDFCDERRMGREISECACGSNLCMAGRQSGNANGIPSRTFTGTGWPWSSAGRNTHFPKASSTG